MFHPHSLRGKAGGNGKSITSRIADGSTEREREREREISGSVSKRLGKQSSEESDRKQGLRHVRDFYDSFCSEQGKGVSVRFQRKRITL